MSAKTKWKVMTLLAILPWGLVVIGPPIDGGRISELATIACWSIQILILAACVAAGMAASKSTRAFGWITVHAILAVVGCALLIAARILTRDQPRYIYTSLHWDLTGTVLGIALIAAWTSVCWVIGRVLTGPRIA